MFLFLNIFNLNKMSSDDETSSVVQEVQQQRSKKTNKMRKKKKAIDSDSELYCDVETLVKNLLYTKL